MSKIKVLDRVLSLPDETSPFTLGELSAIKRHYDIRIDPDAEEIDLTDPDMAQAMIFTLMKRDTPDAPDDEIKAQVASLSTIEVLKDKTSPKAPPKRGGKRAATAGK